MISKKNLFLVNLFIFLVTTETFASPKRSWNGEPKEKQSLPIIEDRLEEVREASSEEKLVNNKDDISAKRRKDEGTSLIVEASSQEAQNSSLNIPTISVAINNLLWKQGIPTLYRLALHRLIRLPQEHSIFSEGLPPQLFIEVIEPYDNRTKQMIQELDDTCQHYDLYQLSEEKKKKEHLITLKKGVQKALAECMEHISQKNYPKALLGIEAMSVQLPYLKITMDSIKEGKNIHQKYILARSCSNLEKGRFLASSFQAIKEKIKVAMLTGSGRAKLIKLLLSEKEASPLEIESSHQILNDHENKLVQITSLTKCQKQVLEQSEELTLTPEKMEEVKIFSGFFLSVFSEKLDQAFPEGDEEGLQLLNKKRNACDQIMKVIMSKELQIQGMKKKIVETNKEIIRLLSAILETKARQHELAQIKKEQLTTYENGMIKAQGKDYAPIFDLYQLPNDFLNRQISLLQAAQEDLLEGRREISNRRFTLAQRWKLLEVETKNNINNLSQIGLKPRMNDLLDGRKFYAIQILNSEEKELENEALSFPLDLEMISLAWDFKKTFEENLETFAQKET
ncbi:MAG: hypothetical protein K2W97_07355 [Chthoniobacterales bacterium]|nr:hypothetical protein [Chthoniobacterales bacterium]